MPNVNTMMLKWRIKLEVLNKTKMHLTFNKSPAWLHQVVNYHNMAASGIPLFDTDNPLITFPDFVAYDLQRDYI